MGLLRFLIISICLLWAVRFIVRLVLPLVFQSLVGKAQQQASRSYQNQNSYQQHKPEGKIHIDYVPPKDKEAKAADKAGDFVEFEEIK
ncbi:DUF4834 family protein [Pedobacter sp. HMF7647]|uniref:DUF4834 family protein n=1 Tax=Hufsiella arboris TaxID=2695275 RepID=A0A7K1YAR7_9SPHI|nr:DUF4834 family protein [Hufsiella arboris]MXV51672.1 DUF4834 family protein [Hufsiella arboris]